MLDKLKKVVKSYAFNISLVIVFTGLVLWLTLKDNFDTIMGMLSRVQVGWIVAIVLVAVFIQCVIGWCLTQLTSLSNPHYKLKHGIINAFVASFFHGVTPSASGGQFAQVYIFKKQGVPLSDSASVLWMDFIIYQSTMVISVLILLLLRFHHYYSEFSQFFVLVLVGFIMNSAIIIGLWALARFPKVYTWISTKGIEIACKIHIVKDREKTLANLDAQLKRFDGETKKLSTHKSLIAKVAIGNVVRLFCYYSMPYLCALALNVPIHPNMLLDVIALAAFVSMINAFIPIPGASGGTEATFVLMFSVLFGKIAATSIMILWRLATYYIVLILGGGVFIYAKTQPDVDTYEIQRKDTK